MRRPLKHPRVPLDVLLGCLLGRALVGRGAVLGVGLFDVSARDGHWPLVPWVLHTAYERSVGLRAPPDASVPELDDEALVTLGAAHFDGACSQCHGTPARERGGTVRAMLPEPPHVSEAVEGWTAAELFWIVKNGVKMSGMPYWPSTARDDGVWAVVAFLERVERMDADAYEALLGRAKGVGGGAGEGGTGGAEPPRAGAREGETRVGAILASCAVCHGIDGTSRGNTHVPRLDLQDESYLAASLAAYRDGRRHSGIMRHAAASLSDADITRLAEHYASQGTGDARSVGAGTAADTYSDRETETEAGADVDTNAVSRTIADVDEGGADAANEDAPSAREALLVRGRALASGASGTLSEHRDVPVCAACHGPWPTPLARRYPPIAGQHEGFLLAQLRAWKAGTRGGTALARMMHEVAPALEDEDMRALAVFYASLPAVADAKAPAGETKEP